MIVIAGTIPVRPEAWEKANAVAANMVEETLREPGCISYQFHTAASPAITFFVFEEWESEEALAAHFETPHLQSFPKEAPKLLAGALDAKKYTVKKSESLTV